MKIQDSGIISQAMVALPGLWSASTLVSQIGDQALPVVRLPTLKETFTLLKMCSHAPLVCLFLGGKAGSLCQVLYQPWSKTSGMSGVKTIREMKAIETLCPEPKV